MKIGEVIRKYRREKQMTQEEMACALGVTAPAVNKWEKGNSVPDVLLLAPIARLLGISTDTLLSYQEELTEKELNDILQSLSEQIRQGNYDKVFLQGKEKVEEFPNCEKLALNVAQLFDGYQSFLDKDVAEKYTEEARKLYLRTVQSACEQIRQTAALGLFQICMREENYEKAEEYLNQIPEYDGNARRLRALLFVKQGKIREAHQLYERILFDGYNDISWSLNGSFGLALKEKNLEQAQFLVQKQKEIVRVMEMGTYMEVSAELPLALYKKDSDKILELLQEIVASAETLTDFKKSRLYRHMEFSETTSENIKWMLAKSLEKDEDLEFLKEDTRFGEIQRKLSEVI